MTSIWDSLAPVSTSFVSHLVIHSAFDSNIIVSSPPRPSSPIVRLCPGTYGGSRNDRTIVNRRKAIEIIILEPLSEESRILEKGSS